MVNQRPVSELKKAEKQLNQLKLSQKDIACLVGIEERMLIDA
jgi:hypothetical protein